MEDIMDFIRSYRIFNPQECNLRVFVIGAGSTGSFTALNLAKMGISDITVIDFDDIEKHNIPNQFYRLSDCGKKKVVALKEIIKDFTGTEIKTIDGKIDKDFNMDIGLNTIVINCVDNMDSREIVHEKLKDITFVKMIDTRFGGEEYSIHYVDYNDNGSIEKYESELFGLEIKDTSCGEKAVIYTIMSLASEVCGIVKKINDGSSINLVTRRHMTNYNFLTTKQRESD